VPPGFLLLSWNATGLSEAKTRELLSLALAAYGLIIIAVQESWKDDAALVNGWAAEFGYQWFGLPRKGRKGGGVGFFVHSSLLPWATFQADTTPKHGSCAELAWLVLKLRHRGRSRQVVHLASVYMSNMPNSNHRSPDIACAWEHLQGAVGGRVAAGHQCVLLGDFNARIGCAVLHISRRQRREGPWPSG
jgi:exonuclease III